MSKRYPGGILRKTPQTPSQTSAQGVWDMASVTQAVKENTWPIAGVPDPISKSLRFRSSASAYLNRTFGTPTNNKKWTWSGWIKRGTLSTASIGFFGQYTDASNRADFYFDASDNLNFYNLVAGSVAPTPQWITSQVFRDPSAWYHIIIVWDSNNATAGDRIIIYVNGSRVTAYSSQGTVTSGQASQINSAAGHNLGRFQNASTYFDGYMTEVYFIDGQALTPSSFGGTNDQTGVWQPIAYTGTYGTNGFYLPFSNTASTATLGYDFSGNSNNWTTNNISLTSGTTYDSMVDVPTLWIPYNTAGDTGALWRGNYCTLNPLRNTSAGLGTISNGNLRVAGTQGSINCIAAGTMAFSGKMYCEMTIEVRGSDTSTVGVGIVPITSSQATTAANMTTGIYYLVNGNRRVTGTTSAYGSSYTTGDVIGIAVDTDAETVTFYKNNVSQGSISGTGVISAGVFPYIGFQDSGSPSVICNFGQQPFVYTPPSGFRTLNTTNLPTPTIGATASTQANRYFDVLTWTGDGASSRAITGLNFQPDWVWDKMRSGAYQHAIVDSVRGGNQVLHSNSTSAEDTNWQYGYVSSFNSNGFTIQAGATSSENWNLNGSTFVAWNWKANGSGSTNTAGSITSTVSANTTAGFSIVTYTGTGANATVGHGLGVAPSMIIARGRSAGTAGFNWRVYHGSLAATAYLEINLTSAQQTDATVWNSTAPTSSVFSLGSSGNVNGSTQTYVAYCFAQVAGYSAFGSYTGNGSSDGPFVFTGFRPRFIMVKNTSAANQWNLWDTSRNTYNAAGNVLFPNNSNAEDTVYLLDILSNGFKPRVGAGYAMNDNGNVYIYMAFAEFPQKFSLAR